VRERLHPILQLPDKSLLPDVSGQSDRNIQKPPQTFCHWGPLSTTTSTTSADRAILVIIFLIVAATMRALFQYPCEDVNILIKYVYILSEYKISFKMSRWRRKEKTFL
jgi:hypothetical protein